MTRGNQRELARAKNAKKMEKIKKSQSSNDKTGNKGASMEARKLRDADIMREKQMKAQAQKDAGAGGASGSKK